MSLIALNLALFFSFWSRLRIKLNDEDSIDELHLLMAGGNVKMLPQCSVNKSQYFLQSSIFVEKVFKLHQFLGAEKWERHFKYMNLYIYNYNELNENERRMKQLSQINWVGKKHFSSPDLIKSANFINYKEKAMDYWLTGSLSEVRQYFLSPLSIAC